MIIKSFKVTGIFLALDGSEDHLFRNKNILQQADQPENEWEGEDEEEDPFNSDCDSENDSESESDSWLTASC